MANAHHQSERNSSGLVLPAYVLLRPEGVFIKLSPPPAQDILQLFIDRLFSNETRFEDLDYTRFIDLLYGSDYLATAQSGVNEVRIASAIVRFPPHRMELYRRVKIRHQGEVAEYMFEPVFVDHEHGGNGDSQPTPLDFDEFVASVWVKGVRFGIDADAVRDAIKNLTTVRLDFAFQLLPTDSIDAKIVEESEYLRQDNAPLILPNGMVDLRRAKNRFPQISKNSPLLRKIPRELGKPGFKVTGTIFEPRIPVDIDLNQLAGEGTRIEQTPRGEVMLAGTDGFLCLDEKTSEIFISNKIENKGGISAKATGDLKLDVDEFTEHGEVQEGRVVEGKHMVFLSDVFGTIISQDGDIKLGKNLSGGRAQSIGGNILVKGKVINSTMEAMHGNIHLEFAEGSLIMAKKVFIGHAVNCEIVAMESQLGITEGCGIVGKNIQITISTARKHRESVIAVLLPDIAAFDRQITEAKHNLDQIETALQAKNREILATQTDPGFARYMTIAEKVRAGTIQFTNEQQEGWKKITEQFAPLVRGTDGLIKRHMALADSIKRWEQERASSGGRERCKIEAIQGDTVVRKIFSNQGMSMFTDLPETDVRAQLHHLGVAQDRIFSGEHGNLNWTFSVPGAPASHS